MKRILILKFWKFCKYIEFLLSFFDKVFEKNEKKCYNKKENAKVRSCTVFFAFYFRTARLRYYKSKERNGIFLPILSYYTI